MRDDVAGPDGSALSEGLGRMDEQQVIVRQAIKLERLEVENAHLKSCISRARSHIICIGGPLNDNKLGYSREQMATFAYIKEELDAA